MTNIHLDSFRNINADHQEFIFFTNGQVLQVIRKNDFLEFRIAIANEQIENDELKPVMKYHFKQNPLFTVDISKIDQLENEEENDLQEILKIIQSHL